ncbi:Uncharacterized protein APZ42_034544 [Daphnia magna]|uniref:Uncharacterized protein n=1 Tax=Daphnia magna TaxID=35525 RepID=A0A164K2D4_9CRUS|nr:Uncharacterized protein APZ42_034544 [Daphnia magna]
MTTDVHLTSYEVDHSAGKNHVAVVPRVKLNTVEDLQNETSNFYGSETNWVSSDGDVDNDGGLETLSTTLLDENLIFRETKTMSSFREQLASLVIHCQVNESYVDKLLFILQTIPERHLLDLP